MVESACPLDCPDSCSLAVTVRHGRVIALDGANANPVTNGYICAKVRRFGERVYGPDRLLYPAVRKGRKGDGRFSRVSWDEALELVADRMREAIASSGAESILPFSYGGSNGLLTDDNLDATLWRRIGASRLARTVCAAPTGAANMALYGKMASVTYQDYVDAAMIVLWGVNPSASGIHLVPYVREAQKRGAKLVVIDPRTTPLARSADIHLAVRPGTDIAVALAFHRHLFTGGLADEAFLSAHTSGVELLRERAAEWTFERAAAGRGHRSADSRTRRRPLRPQHAGADPMRLGARTKSKRGQCGHGRAGAARGRREVRRPRRRLLDEQLRGVEHREILDRRAGARQPSRQHEPPGTCADRVPTTRRFGSCSRTTAIPWRRSPTSAVSSKDSNATTSSRSFSIRS